VEGRGDPVAAPSARGALRERPKAHSRLTWPDRAWLTLLAGTLPAGHLAGLRLIVTPATIVRWHRDIVQRPMQEAVAPAVAHVFASDGGRPLVACLAATDAVHTPEQAHDRCMDALTRHPTTITPRHYVICRTAPSDPADPTAWPEPLATGTGRA
jgi:hypothetical protein